MKKVGQGLRGGYYLPNPNGIKTKEKIIRHCWFFVQQYLVATSPKFANKWRLFWLKMFGAQIGRGCYIASSAYVHLPWKIIMEDNVTIDARCYLQGEIWFGEHAAIGNNVHIITEGHNVRSRYFEGTNNAVVIGSGCFIGGDAYIARGVHIGTLSVIGAKSVVWHDVPENSIAYGNPCECHGNRIDKREFSNYYGDGTK